MSQAQQYFAEEPTALIDIDFLDHTALSSKHFASTHLPFLPDN